MASDPTTSSANPQSYSQFGEDRLVWEHFGRKTSGCFAEVGANDPEKLSQTRMLELIGWRGVLVEPVAVRAEMLRQLRPDARVFQAACGAPEQCGRATFYVPEGQDVLASLQAGLVTGPVREEEVTVTTLDQILGEAKLPALDFLSIDVEGAELQVLQGFSLARHRPALLMIEDHVESLDVHRHLTRSGYKLVRRTGCNNWYVPQATVFHVTLAERARLFRKMHLSHPLRLAKARIKGR